MTTFTFATDTTAPNACMHDYQLKAILGTGLFSTVWEACTETACPYAVKVVIIRPEESQLPDIIWPGGIEGERPLFETTKEDNFWKEVELMKTAAQIGVGPKFYNA